MQSTHPKSLQDLSLPGTDYRHPKRDRRPALAGRSRRDGEPVVAPAPCGTALSLPAQPLPDKPAQDRVVQTVLVNS